MNTRGIVLAVLMAITLLVAVVLAAPVADDPCTYTTEAACDAVSTCTW